MYEAKYKKYITKSETRFAELEEVKNCGVKLDKSKKNIGSGVPLCYDENGVAYIDNEDNHTVIIGPSGCKKTRTAIIPSINSIINSGESAIISDPKGELYANTALNAEIKGANVHVLNFRHFNCDSWNPLKPVMDYFKEGNTRLAYQLINDFVEQIISPNLEKTNDRYWIDEAKMLLNAIILILLDSSQNCPELFNIGVITQLASENNVEYFKSLHSAMREDCIASMCLNSVIYMPEKTRACIFGTLQSCLEPFTKNEELLSMLSNNNIDIFKLSEEQTIIYLIYPDEKTTYNSLINAFLTQSYEQLVEKASENCNDRLKIRLNYVLDEFSNLPKIESFENRISESRSKNIRYFLCLQSFNQLKAKYDKNAETIISNCNNWLCYSSKEMEFLTRIAELCGKEMDYNGNEHYLLNPFEMQHLKKSKESVQVVLIKQGLFPFVSELIDFEYLPDYRRAKKVIKSNPPSSNKKISFTAGLWFELLFNHRLPMPFSEKGGKTKKESLIELFDLLDTAK